jgi:hypothetical protein
MISTQGELRGMASELTWADKAAKSGSREKTLKHFIFQTRGRSGERNLCSDLKDFALQYRSKFCDSAGIRSTEKDTYFRREGRPLASMSGMCLIARSG